MQNKTVSEWLSEYKNRKTRNDMNTRLEKFLASVNMSIEDLMKLTSKEAKHLVLQYQAKQVKAKIPNNTILANITSVRALFKFLEKPLVFGRGRLVQLQEGKKHSFSNGDLGKMFEVADLRGKAIIALGSSLGWGIGDALRLDRHEIETLIARAKEENKQFTYFKKRRGKTNAKAYGILNPLAIEWVSKWLAKHKGKNLFDIKEDMVNKELQRLAIEANLKLLGKVSYHCFRGWVFNSLIKSGISEPESKYVVGKKLPISDSTYLTLEEGIQEKYQEAYEKYFNFTATKIDKQAREELEAYRETIRQQATLIKTLTEKIDSLTTRVTHIEGFAVEEFHYKKPKPSKEG